MTAAFSAVSNQGFKTMQRVTLVRYAAKPDRADENQTLSLEVFNELKTVRPDNIAYALFRDGVDFVHLFVNLRGDDAGVLTDLPTFQAFAKDVNDRSEAPPEATRLSLKLLASYGL
jgi:hypothetical protein